MRRCWSSLALSYPDPDRDDTLVTDCYANYPDLTFVVDNKKILVSKWDYVKDDSKDRSKCRLAIKKIDAPFNILGAPAYLDYYITHTWDENTMAFSPHQLSAKPEVEEMEFGFDGELTHKIVKRPWRSFWWWLMYFISTSFCLVWFYAQIDQPGLNYFVMFMTPVMPL